LDSDELAPAEAETCDMVLKRKEEYKGESLGVSQQREWLDQSRS